MSYEIGDRVISTEVAPRVTDELSQEKVLEIIKFIDENTVECKYFIESTINPEINYYQVSITSLTPKNKKPLKAKGLEKDPFFDNFR